MQYTLKIQRAYWPEVTDTPHFSIELQYGNCHQVFDDIYFDKIDDIIEPLENLLIRRKGRVELSGGFRFGARVEATSSGALRLGFSTESSGIFPGRLRLDGEFLIDGEHAEEVIASLLDLFRQGDDFFLETTRPTS